MAKVIEPIHIGIVNGKRLRFFGGPDQRPTMPFHCHDDLLECLELSDELRRIFKLKLVNDWREQICTVPTNEGIVTIAPHYVAQGLIGAALSVFMCVGAKQTDKDYLKEGAAALGALARRATGDLGPAARMKFVLAAHKNQ